MEKERQLYQAQISYLQAQIKELELERVRMLDRLMLKNSLPPVHAKLDQRKPAPMRMPHEQAVENARQRVEDDAARRAVFQAKLDAMVKAKGFSTANVDPAVYDELSREVS